MTTTASAQRTGEMKKKEKERRSDMEIEEKTISLRQENVRVKNARDTGRVRWIAIKTGSAIDIR